MSVYIDDYHSALDRRIGASTKATEMITELYVPRSQLAAFMLRAACELRSHGLPVIYGTVRLIERDEESFLAWAREDWACVVFNLHVEHTCNGIESARAIFSALIDTAQEHGGSYYLTYHRWATCNQLARCYPRFREFVRCKERQDPAEIFQSNWWRHYRRASQG